MGKKAVIILFILFNIYIIYSIPRPNKNKEVGAVMGRISLSGMWDITLYLKNNKTGRDYIIKPIKRKYYYLLNLEPGPYSLYKFGISRSTSTHYYWAGDLKLVKNDINIIIEPNKITPINYLEINIGYTRYSVNMDNIDPDEYINDLKLYFEGLDNKGFWKSFEWKEIKDEINLMTIKKIIYNCYN